MPTFERKLSLPQPVAAVFSLLLHPRQTVLLAPPELHVQVVEAPERLELGSRVTRTARRMGMALHSVSVVTRLEPNLLLVESQLQGPFRAWVHSSHLTSDAADGCELRETIDFEPPGGMLGFVVTEKFIRNDLEGMFDYRHQKLRELLS